MHLISALAGGVIGAESGTAVIYRRGTTLPATWYSDFETDSGSSSTVAPVLDSTGAAVVYVNELVTVRVMTSAGELLKSFVAGADSPNVEVKSLSQTGTNYETAVVAAGQPTTLQVVVDRWLTSAGAPDWNVLVGSTAQTLQSIAAGLDGIVFNVKDPTYGAVADGTTDDGPAFQLAIDAADAAGGGTVFFPPGDYYAATGMDLDKSSGNVIDLLGSGSGQTVITFVETAVCITIDVGASTAVHAWTGFTVKYAAASTAAMTSIAGTAWTLKLRDVVLGDSTGTYLSTLRVINAATSAVDAEGCWFYFGAVVANQCITTTTSSSFRNCTFLSPAAPILTAPMLALGYGSFVSESRFYAGAGATSTAFVQLTSTFAEVRGNLFNGSNTQAAVLLGSGASGNVIDGNTISACVSHVDAGTNAAFDNTLGDAGRPHAYSTSTANTLTVNPEINSGYAYWMTGSNLTLALTIEDTVALRSPWGTKFTMTIAPTSLGGDLVVTMSPASVGSPVFTISDNTVATLHFEVVSTNLGTHKWMFVGYAPLTAWGYT